MPPPKRVPLTPDQIEARLNEGQWLIPGHVARLLGISRSTVVRMLTDEPPKIGSRLRGLSNDQRECDPADVRRLLAKRRDSYRAAPPPSE